MCREGRIIHSDEAENDARKDSFPTEYLNNAEKVLKLRIDTTASTEELQRQIEEVVSVLCPFMIRDAKNTPLQIKPLTGGLSNHLFLVSAAGTSLVLVRIHPDADQQQTCDDNNDPEDSFSIVDRDFETKFAAWLATQQEDLPHNRSTMAPAMYGRFENGRIEEFYPNVRPLACPEMKTYAPWIAQSMASFHSLGHPPEDILQAPPTSVGGTRNSTIYQTIRAWLNEASRAQLDEATNEFLKELSKEWDWLENILAEPPKEDSLKGDNNSKNPIVAEALEFVRRMAITHMDCQPLNILIGDNGAEDKKEGMVQDLDTLRLIDFEYSGWNPIVSRVIRKSVAKRIMHLENFTAFSHFPFLPIGINTSFSTRVQTIDMEQIERLPILPTLFANIVK